MDGESQGMRMDESCNPTLNITKKISVCGILPTDRLIHDLMLSMSVSAVAPCQRRNEVCDEILTLLPTHNWIQQFKFSAFR